jgi:hypothetical protein
MFWHTINIVHLHQELSKLLDWQWLGINLIHTTVYGFFHVLVLHMPSDGHDLGLLFAGDVHCQEKLSDTFGGFVPIQERHVAVHQDQGETEWVLLVHRCLYGLHCLLTVVSELSHFCALLEA